MNVIVAKGYSMSPLFREGDVIHIDRLDQIMIKWGDIVVFNYEKRMVAHRFMFRYTNTIVLKGDNTCHIEKITSKDVIGKIHRIDSTLGSYYLNGAFYRLISIYFFIVSLCIYISRGNRFVKRLFKTILKGRTLLLRLLILYQSVSKNRR